MNHNLQLQQTHQLNCRRIDLGVDQFSTSMWTFIGIPSYAIWVRDAVLASPDSPGHNRLYFAGYSNEVGEAFRPLVPKAIVAASYGMAIGYVCTDTFDKSLREKMAGASSREVGIAAADVFSWQMLASVVIPGLVINRYGRYYSRLCVHIVNHILISFFRFLPTASPRAAKCCYGDRQRFC